MIGSAVGVSPGGGYGQSGVGVSETSLIAEKDMDLLSWIEELLDEKRAGPIVEDISETIMRNVMYGFNGLARSDEVFYAGSETDDLFYQPFSTSRPGLLSRMPGDRLFGFQNTNILIGANPLDNSAKPFIIFMKDGEEDEYAPPGRYREREWMRARPYSSAEWTSESQGKRLTRR